MDYLTVLPSPIGPLQLKSDGTALTELKIGSFPGVPSASLPLFLQAEQWLQVYWQGRDPGPVPFPLAPEGTPFQQQVWSLLLSIPYGTTCSYGDLAKKMGFLTGKPRMSPQAIGTAVGRNPIALLIPCHRVIGSRGQLTGYAYGLSVKKQLLELEGVKLP